MCVETHVLTADEQRSEYDEDRSRFFLLKSWERTKIQKKNSKIVVVASVADLKLFDNIFMTFFGKAILCEHLAAEWYR